MKIKSLYLYLTIVVFAVVFLTVAYLLQLPKGTVPAGSQSAQMPQDDIHKGAAEGQQAPSKMNVSPEYTQKLNELKEAVEKTPNDTARVKEYADFLAASHKTDEAIVYYEKILKVYPKRTDIRMTIASLYYSKQDFTKCEISLNSVLSYDKNNYQALFNLGAVAATKGDNVKAKNIWNDVISRCPDKNLVAEAKAAVNGLN
jgi:Uncharacterized protein conserved in bacteria